MVLVLEEIEPGALSLDARFVKEEKQYEVLQSVPQELVAHLFWLDCGPQPPSSDQLSLLAKFANLQRLSVTGGQWTSSRLEPITALPALRYLRFRNARLINPEQLFASEGANHQLERLVLWNTVLEDEQFAALTKGLPDCEITRTALE